MMSKGKFVFPLFASFLILTAFASISEAKTIYVPDDYAKIQWAVDNASARDTIIVRDGIYYESITVSKKLTIKSENGSENCIVNGTGSNVFTLKADGIRIEGFTITGGKYGIHLRDSNNNTIINNIIRSNNVGMHIWNSNNNIMSDNIISSNNWGIFLWVSNNNNISNNNISSNGCGIDLSDSSNNSISDNIICSNNETGIFLRNSNNNIMSDNIISSNKWNGIYLRDSNNNSILNNNISSNDYGGIYLKENNNNSILNNNISLNNGFGIDLCGSNNNIVSNNNICSNKWDGIILEDSNNNSISNNIISSNKWNGIRLSFSNENTIKNNEFVNDGFYVLCSYGNIVEDNKVNGKPLFYLEEESDKIVHKAGQVILVRCKNITVVNSELTNTDIGIELFESDECLISKNNVSNNLFGIYLEGNNNSISNNLISNNGLGIYLERSNNNISNNNISSNGCGIYLSGSNNIISDNIICSNNWGISLSGSNNTIRNNEFINDGLFVGYSYDNIVEDNEVNGKPLVYLEDESDKIIDDAGQIILVRCKNITVMNAEIKNTDVGIELFKSDECLISKNNISSNDYGIYIDYSNNNSVLNNNISSNKWEDLAYAIFLYSSKNNSILNNKISNNDHGICFEDGSSNNIISKNNISSNDYGIYIDYSNNNIIYMNNFINNTNNTYYSFYSTNTWNSTSKITYTYRGSEFTNYMGNYWDDYNGSDANEDGIGETPYIIDENNIDNYPLIERFGNYFMPTPAQIFDTKRPENPYPSISGKFIGTIKTNKKVIATKLYTYACEGTGGHTEYALICNSTWCAYAEWDGYKGDWINISFNRTVVLMPYETYNITIVTGSYPQIHHTSSLKTESGWINCTEFTDANGKKYDDWIPAFMLWS